MPTVAVVEGINIELYFDDHPPPHFHAGYAEFLVQIDMTTLDIMTVQDWASPRRAALRAAWDACRAGANPGRIA